MFAEQLIGWRSGECNPLSYALIYSTLLHHTILYYITLHYISLYYTILYYTILYYTILYYTILYYTILWKSPLHCPQPCSTVLYSSLLLWSPLYTPLLYSSSLQLVYCNLLHHTLLCLAATICPPLPIVLHLKWRFAWSHPSCHAGVDFDITELTGEAGDVILLHPFLLHARSKNLAPLLESGVRFLCHPAVPLK